VKKSTVAVVAAALLLPALARADRRYYGETYNAVTAQPGGLDVELWSTLHQDPRAVGNGHLWRHQLELETGITERWDVAVYNIWVGPQDQSTQYEATKLETRYRLSRPGEWIVDPILYLELRKEWISDKPTAVEEKLILGKDVGAWNTSLNLSAEQEFIPGGDREYEYGYALGQSYEVLPWFRVGGEVFGDWRRAAGSTLSEHWAGPSISLAYSKVWLVTALGFGLNDDSERLRARAVLAYQF
jgi:hypothetical protein